MHHHELKLDSNKANLTAEGHRLDNLPVPSMPWRPSTDLCFFQLNINYRQIKTTHTNFSIFVAPRLTKLHSQLRKLDAKPMAI